MMKSMTSYRKFICLCMVCVMATCMICCSEPSYAAVNDEKIITKVENPETGVISCDVTVPPGERIDYSVTLTPDKADKLKDTVSGSLKNKTKKTITKTVTMNVKYLSDRYKITASYTKDTKNEEICYTDVDKVTSALQTSVVTAKFAWDSRELGKGEKGWKYRYKYVPCKDGFKKYVQVFDNKGKHIKDYVKQSVSITKITKLIKEMVSR